ncbi:MAG: hypothetical protein Q8O55_10355 [Dehalococcoidales bacterium]|nr:hypothetical protein [Dehalococcoidales bacterium]
MEVFVHQFVAIPVAVNFADAPGEAGVPAGRKRGDMRERIIEQMADAEAKAWEALSGYKFWMFGYHAARWVNYKQLLGEAIPSPFHQLVEIGRFKTDASIPGKGAPIGDMGL